MLYVVSSVCVIWCLACISVVVFVYVHTLLSGYSLELQMACSASAGVLRLEVQVVLQPVEHRCSSDFSCYRLLGSHCIAI